MSNQHNDGINNKRIVKNTALLYVRMLFIMAVSLYTSRVVLATLGVDDYGLYSVVGGIVSMLSFLNSSMAGATQRFLNMEIGKRDFAQLQKVFNTSQVIHIAIAIIVFILAETIGSWFLNTYMNIAEERLRAANWVFQLSVLSFIITIISVPYNAAIIAHEKMSAFAYISVIEILLRLAIVYMLYLTSWDKLIVYAVLRALIAIVIRLIYSWYCSRNFEECKKFDLHYDREVLKKMSGFSGWTVVGALGGVSHTQGIAIVINLFFGVAVNAAQGVANQVIGVVNQFVTNFMIALNPQIVKSYAANNLTGMHQLLQRGCRMGFFLVTFFAIPLIIEAPFILSLWLKEVPPYTVIFVRIILFTSIFNSFASPLAHAKGATGNIRNYQILLTSLGLIHVPLAWICFELGGEPYAAMIVYLVLIIIMQICRIYMVCNSIDMDIRQFYKDVVGRCLIALSIAAIPPLLLHQWLPESNYWHLCTFFISIITTMACIAFVGMNKYERTAIKSLLTSKLKR